jgi:hypothetical protein
MWRGVAAALLVAGAFSAAAEVPVEKVRIDTHVVERVLDASRRSAPTDVLRRIVLEDIEMLRGARADGAYDYAYYDRYEAERHEQSFSIKPLKDDQSETVEVKGAFIYRVVLEVPSRRLLVTRNRRVWVERVEFDTIAQGQSGRSSHVTEVKAWLEPGTSHTIELPHIARQMTARVVARADTDAGYGNLVVNSIEARIIDDPKSPFAGAVSAAKSLLRAVEGGEAPAMRNYAAAMRAALPAANVPVVAYTPPPQPVVTQSAPADLDRAQLQSDLERIQDLLTGTDAEKLEGLERLHQLVRRVRTR